MHPNSLANLKPPWEPGQRPPSPGPSKLERALKISQDAAPNAARLIARTVNDPEVPIALRLRCAEYLLDKALPRPTSGPGLQLSGMGVEFLELRFVAPGQAKDIPSLEAQAISSTYTEDAEISHASPHTDVEQESEEDQ